LLQLFPRLRDLAEALQRIADGVAHVGFEFGLTRETSRDAGNGLFQRIEQRGGLRVRERIASADHFGQELGRGVGRICLAAGFGRLQADDDQRGEQGDEDRGGGDRHALFRAMNFDAR
jgi:hypothetical protein